MEALLKLLPGPQPIYIRYGATALMVLLAHALKLGVNDIAGPYAFIIYVPAFVAAALMFDRLSGYLGVALSACAVAWSLPWTPDRFDAHVSALALFVIVSSGLVYMSEGLHRAL